ncbi:MAG: CHRD domain-containing protein, partial [Blastocatellia bacterium]
AVVNGGVVIPLAAGSPSIGAAVVTPAQVNQILAAGWYVNIHTQMFPGGEIRGQVRPGPSIASVFVKCPGNQIQCCPDPIKICTGTRLEWCISDGCSGPIQIHVPAGPGPGFPFNTGALPGATTPTSPRFLIPGTYPVVLTGVGITSTCLVKVIETNLTPRNGGNGCDGPFEPTVNTVLDTSVQSVYNFSRVLIPAGVVVRAVGPNPITIKCRGKALINGVLNASGFAGTNSGNNLPGGAGGAGGPGGGAGGAGANGGTGNAGLGASPGQGGLDLGVPGGSFTETVGGGGGGGNASAGAQGGPPNSGSILGNGSGPGGPAAAVCRAGSGGGGGGGDVDAIPPATAGNDGGAGGGGGGGWLCFYSDRLIVVGPAGVIAADGGAGGTNAGNGGGGGGGSGGRVELAAPAICVGGLISARGGLGGSATQTNCGCSPGGAGGLGCIAISGELCASSATSIVPPPALCPHGLMITPACPTGYLDVWTTQNQPYLAALSLTCGPPIPVPPYCPPFELNFFDSLFMATFPVNTLAPILTGATGPPANRVCFDLSPFGLPPGFDLKLWIQAISFDPTHPLGIGGISCKTPIMIKF